MRLPTVHGTIKRRLLINYRVDPIVIGRVLPPPFRPKLHQDSAIVGLCLIRLEDIRPRSFPLALGLSSENAAHRIAVVWEDRTGAHEGVYIPRRDTGSLVNHLIGGRLFPGEHHRATFRVTEEDERIDIHMRSADGQVELNVAGHTAGQLPPSSLFRTVHEASTFFKRGSIGYSVTSSENRLDGIRLKTDLWHVEPFAVEKAFSNFFEDPTRFPAGAFSLDCGLVMRNLPHAWETAEDMYVTRSDRCAL
jgi:hypothetical protein